MHNRGTSVDSDRRYLLTVSRPPSIASVITQDVTPDDSASVRSRVTFAEQSTTMNLTRSASVPDASQSYRGFPSREAYYAALEQFAQERKFFKPEQQLVGFYHHKTMADYVSEKGGARSMSKEQRRAEKERRKSLKGQSKGKRPLLDGVPEEDDGEQGAVADQTLRRASWNILGRRASRAT